LLGKNTIVIKDIQNRWQIKEISKAMRS